MENTEVKLSTIFKQLGISPNLLGYKYLKEAVNIVIADESVLHGAVTKVLYPEIAVKFKTTPSRVERALRHAIETATFKGSTELMDKIFGFTISALSGKPTNSQFIACVADYLVLTEGSDE